MSGDISTSAQRDMTSSPFLSLGRVLAIGTIAGVQQAFAGMIKGPVERTPLSADELRFERGAVVSLLKRALVRSLAKTNGLASDGREVIWDTTASEARKHG